MCIRDRPNTDRNSPAVSQMQANQEQNTDRDLNGPPPERFQFRPGNHELTTPNESNRSPKGMATMNHNADLYGKITHFVEKILTEIPYTDGLNVSKLLTFISYLLQIKDLQQLNVWQILQVLLQKCKPPLKIV